LEWLTHKTIMKLKHLELEKRFDSLTGNFFAGRKYDEKAVIAGRIYFSNGDWKWLGLALAMMAK
jgi:hypothetical protein